MKHMRRKCVTCGSTFSNDGTYHQHNGFCSKDCLREYKREYMREYYQKRKEENVCYQCGRDLSEIFNWDSTRCPECLEKKRNYKFYGVNATEDEIRLGVKDDE